MTTNKLLKTASTMMEMRTMPLRTIGTTEASRSTPTSLTNVSLKSDEFGKLCGTGEDEKREALDPNKWVVASKAGVCVAVIRSSWSLDLKIRGSALSLEWSKPVPNRFSGFEAGSDKLVWSIWFQFIAVSILSLETAVGHFNSWQQFQKFLSCRRVLSFCGFPRRSIFPGTKKIL